MPGVDRGAEEGEVCQLDAQVIFNIIFYLLTIFVYFSNHFHQNYHNHDKAPLARFCYFSDKKRGNLGDKSTFLVEKKSTRYVGHKSC